jgi:hypothetical protein
MVAGEDLHEPENNDRGPFTLRWRCQEVTFMNAFIKDLDPERSAGIFVLAAVTPDGRASEIM